MERDYLSKTELFSCTLKSIKQGVIITNPKVKGNPVIYVNPAYTSITGYNFEEVIGKPPLNYNGKETDSHILNEIKNAIKNESSITVEIINYDKYNKKFWNELTLDPVYDGENNLIYYVGLINDITERKKSELKISQKEKILEAVALVSNKLLTGTVLNKSIIEAIGLLGTRTGVDRVYIFKNHLSLDGDMLISQKYEWSKDSISPQINNPELQNLSYKGIGYERWYKELSKGNSISGVIDEFPEEEKEILKSQDILSLLVVPIFASDNFWGFIGFDDCVNERIWSKSEEAILVAVASNIGGAINKHIIEKELKKARISAESASIYKTNFLSNMSHEIRTPLNSIVGIGDLLSETELSLEQRNYVNLFRNAGDTLLTIVNDILDLSKIEAGHVEINETQFNLKNLIEDIINVSRVRLENKDVLLTYKIEDAVPLNLLGDGDKLKQILFNLIGNSIKFTDKGKILLQISLGEKAKDIVSLDFQVIDTGIGISSENITTIFESFTQGDSSFTKKYKGTGLGLTITKILVELLRGEIKVRSKIGEGSTFSFNVEMKEDNTKTQSENSIVEKVVLEEYKKLNILLVDDSEDNRLLVHAFLKKLDYSIDDAANGEDALNKNRLKTYDIILMDMQMPIMDGFTAVKEIRKYEKENKIKEVKIIALTAYAFNEISEKTIQAGCNSILVKPIRKNDLINEINNIISGVKINEK